MEPDDEQELIARAREGSTAAFETLVRRYDRSVLRLARSLTRSDAEAQDVYQETFLKMFRSLGRFRQESGIGTWVHRIAVNACLDHLRRNGARPEQPLEMRPDTGRGDPRGGRRAGPGGGTDIPAVADTAPEADPERAFAGQEVRARIADALAGLPARERVVFRLRHDEGMRSAAIAAILGTSEETVRNCLYRAHQRLRKALGDLVGRGSPAGEDPRGWPAPDAEAKELLK